MSERVRIEPDIEALDWKEKAACKGSDLDFFVPSGETEKVEAVKKICRSCKVATVCLEVAFEDNEKYGIWGGYHENERKNLRRKWLADKRRA